MPKHPLIQNIQNFFLPEAHLSYAFFKLCYFISTLKTLFSG